MINMVTVVGNRVNVTFSRENMISVPNYYNLNATAYIIAARGSYTSSGGKLKNKLFLKCLVFKVDKKWSYYSVKVSNITAIIELAHNRQ